MDPDAQTELLVLLSEPFPADKVKQFKGRGGRSFDYVEGVEVVKKLNAIAKAWSFVNVQVSESRQIDKDGAVIPVTRVIGELEIPGLGRRTGMGVQVMKPGSGEDLEKGALTDAIKNAAWKFGVGIQFYENDDETRRNWTANNGEEPATEAQQNYVSDLVEQGVIPREVLNTEYGVVKRNDLTKAKARKILDRFAPKKDEYGHVRVAQGNDGPPIDDEEPDFGF